MTKNNEKDAAIKLKLLRTAVIDGIRRQRGWVGVTAQPLPQNCFVALSDAKSKAAGKTKTTAKGDK